MQLRRFAVAIGLAVVMLIVSLPVDAFSSPGIALMLYFAMVVVGMWVLYSVLLLLLRRKGQADRLVRLAIWIPALLLVGAGMHWRDSAAREAASGVVAAVSAHKRGSGVYPKTLSEAGLDPAALRRKFNLVYRLDEKGKAALFYSQPSMPMIAHHYDFAAGAWRRED